jgi:hypothetical protein
MVGAYSSQQLRHFTITFNPWEEGVREIERTKMLGGLKDPRLVEATDLGRRMKYAREHPREFIWLGAHNVLVSIVDMHGYSDYKNWTKAKKLLFENDKDDV